MILLLDFNLFFLFYKSLLLLNCLRILGFSNNIFWWSWRFPSQNLITLPFRYLLSNLLLLLLLGGRRVGGQWRLRLHSLLYFKHNFEWFQHVIIIMHQLINFPHSWDIVIASIDHLIDCFDLWLTQLLINDKVPNCLLQSKIHWLILFWLWLLLNLLNHLQLLLLLWL